MDCFFLSFYLINATCSIIETHHKSAITLFGFSITVAGWWAWQAFLSGVYAQTPSPYDVRDGFTHAFGRDPTWWLTLLGVLAVIYVLEMGLKMAKRTVVVILGEWRWHGWWGGKKKRREDDWMEGNLEDWDVGLWQEMEQDEAVKARLKGILEAEERAMAGVGEVEDFTDNEHVDA